MKKLKLNISMKNITSFNCTSLTQENPILFSSDTFPQCIFPFTKDINISFVFLRRQVLV